MIDNAFNSLALEDEPSNEDVKTAEDFLIDHESLLSKLIKKYSSPSVVPHHVAKRPVGS